MKNFWLTLEAAPAGSGFRRELSICDQDRQQPSLHGLLSSCLHSHNEPLWTEFIHRSQPVIAGVVIKSIRRWTKPNPSMVDDLVQETYLKLCANDFRALREFVCHHENALYGFLKVVASNTVQDYFRSSRNQKRGSGRDEEDIELAMLKAEEPHGLYGDMERWILLQQIDECLAGRTAEATCSRDRAIFWLYYRDGLTAKAISELPEIGLSVKGVESTLLRLTRIVRTQLCAAPGGGTSAPEQHVEEARELHSTASCA